MTARTTYVSSVVTAENQRDFSGFTGDAVAPTPLTNTNVTQQYPPISQLKAYYAAGAISYSQFVQMSLATQMYAQTQIRAARDTLVNSGDFGPV